jgi:hypothetical protein
MFIGILSSITALESAGLIFFFSKVKKKKEDESEDEDPYKINLLCRFVLDGAGRKIGESVAIDDDILILKSKNKYLGVPLKHIKEKEKTLLVKGLVDRDMAEIMGEKWRRESFRKIDHDKREENGF